jgi:hypothetical protein
MALIDHDRRKPGQTNAERIADLTSELGPLYRAATSVILGSLDHPPIQWAATTTAKEIANVEARDVAMRIADQAHLDALLQELADLQAGNAVDAGPGPTATVGVVELISGNVLDADPQHEVISTDAPGEIEPADRGSIPPAKPEPPQPRRCRDCGELMPDRACAACWNRTHA